MPRRNFKTVSAELLKFADEAANYFQMRGYRVRIEEFEKGFPYMPTLICKRQRTKVIIEVCNKIDFGRILTWVMYAKSSKQDTRIAICFEANSKDKDITDEQERILRDQGIGLYIGTGSGVIESAPPNDLALGVSLPHIESLPGKLRTLLGSAYDQFNRSHWREGFEDACQAFENEARRYLKIGMSGTSPRIRLVSSRGPRTLTNSQIDRLTMGQLALAFSQIQNQNKADAVVSQALNDIYPDRNAVAHHKSKAETERRLRSNVGEHMWTIVKAMKEML